MSKQNGIRKLPAIRLVVKITANDRLERMRQLQEAECEITRLYNAELAAAFRSVSDSCAQLAKRTTDPIERAALKARALRCKKASRIAADK